MPTYRVELRGDVRELYTVEADSPEDAAEHWDRGEIFLSEAFGMEVCEVTEEDE